jgi:hypothetical protein
MQLEVREIISLGAGLLVLAGLSIAIVNGGDTAKILSASTDGFAKLIKAATLKG